MRKWMVVALCVGWLVGSSLIPRPWWYATIPMSYMLGWNLARLWRWANG